MGAISADNGDPQTYGEMLRDMAKRKRHGCIVAGFLVVAVVLVALEIFSLHTRISSLEDQLRILGPEETAQRLVWPSQWERWKVPVESTIDKRVGVELFRSKDRRRPHFVFWEVSAEDPIKSYAFDIHFYKVDLLVGQGVTSLYDLPAKRKLRQGITLSNPREVTRVVLRSDYILQ